MGRHASTKLTSKQARVEFEQNNLSQGQIAKKYQVSQPTVCRRLRDAGICIYSTKNGSPVAHKASSAKKEPEPKGNELLFSEDYTYNEGTDTYITFLRSSPKPVVIPGAKHRELVRAYSNWNGDPSTLNEICRAFTFPRPWLIEYLRVHGITHDKEPFSNEEVLERDTSVLVEEALQMKRQSLFREFEKAKWADTQAAANKWYDVEQNILVPLTEHIKEFAPAYRPPLLKTAKADRPYALVMEAADFHYGMGAWRDETGSSYTREQARDLLLYHTQNLANDARRYGRPDFIYVPVGNDFFHVDTPEATTTRGTRQDTDGSVNRIFKEGCELQVENIDALRQIGEVRILPARGNHDFMLSYALLMYLQAWYRDASDVSVDFWPGTRCYQEYGQNLMMFTHGDEVKPQAYSGLFLSEARQACGRTRNRMVFTGHLHHEVTREINGITQYQLPTLAASDRWSAGKGYVTSNRALTGYVIDKERGCRATLISPVLEESGYGIKIRPSKSNPRA
jgi:hypothetical protein